MLYQKTLYLTLLLPLLHSCNTKPPVESQPTAWFEHYTVTTDLPPEPNARFGTPAMADFDNDGDLDFALSRTNGPIWWFEFLGDHQWQKHEIGQIPTGQLGGGAFDVDGDGHRTRRPLVSQFAGARGRALRSACLRPLH